MRAPQVEIASQGLADGLSLVLRELYIEIFAILVPGICFFILVVPAIGVPVVDLLGGVITTHYSAALFAALQTHSGIAFFGVLVMSYVIGQMLFRCDPKYPDFASIKARPRDEVEGSCVEELTHGGAEFPYASLRDFLERRNLRHLTKYVTWGKKDFGPNGSERWKHRSKHFINQLKLSIKLYHPRIYFEISRNETHVRLMSSLWYLMKTVIWLASFGLAAGLLSLALFSEDFVPIDAEIWNSLDFSGHGEAILYPAATLGLAIVLKKKIEKYFHYQRVREIVYVLEAWYLIDPKRRPALSQDRMTEELPAVAPVPEAAQ